MTVIGPWIVAMNLQARPDEDCGCCGTLGAECCTSGTACTEGYCADGGSDADHCCPPTFKWNEDQNKCVGTTHYLPSGSADCDVSSPSFAGWWYPDCLFKTSSLACCNVGTKYGYPNYYDYYDADDNLNIETY